MKKILILIAALLAASALAALVTARRNSNGNIVDPFEDSSMDCLGV
ncbi:MAG TPA: hypothetical protein VLX91_05965 [Candidatus Acidoferrales bacterium]|nr:hypothetical protein [Candidatus Acidoferrales bacterium]